MKLRFRGGQGFRCVKTGIKTFSEAMTEIDKDLKAYYPHFTSYYKRYWKVDNEYKFDVGDYSCFYYLELEEGETWEEKMLESLLK